MKTFGCVAYSFVEKQFRKKLDKNSKRGIFLGTSENIKAFLIGIESEGKLKVQKSRNVSFDESKFYFEKKIESDEGERVGDVVFFGEVVENIPKNAKEALTDPDWQEAMKNEFDSLKKNKVWDLVRNRGEKPIGSRWHFALMYGPLMVKFPGLWLSMLQKVLAKLREGIFTKRIRLQPRCRP